MLTLKLISEETERVVKGLEKKCFPNAREAVEKVLEYDRLRRESQQQLDANKQRQNQLSREIGGLMKSGKRDEANQVKEQVAQLKAADKALQEVMQKAQADMNEVLLTIPNIPTDEVPEGRDASSNVVVKEGGVKPDLPEGSLCHWDLLKKFNLVDFDLGVKITGAGFPVYIGKMARFQRALEAFFLDEARKSGYTEVQPPLVVNEASGLGTGQLPRQGGPDVPCQPRQPLPDPHRRGAGDQPLPRRDHRGERAPHQVLRLLRLLPSRGRAAMARTCAVSTVSTSLTRSRSSASTRRSTQRSPTRRCSTTWRACSPSWSFPTTSSVSVAAT